MSIKRRRYDNRSGMAAGVDYLLRQQGRLEGNSPVSVGSPSMAHQTGGASVPTYLVASSITRSAMRAQADFTCNGTDDNLVLQEAFDALPTGGGRIFLTEGTFNLTSPAGLGSFAGMVEMPANSALIGTGPGTVLNVETDSTTTHSGVQAVGANCEIAHMSVTIDASSLANLYAIELQGERGSLHHCWFDGMSASGSDGLWYVLCDNNGVVTQCQFLDISIGGS